MPVQFPSLNWSITLSGNPFQDIIITPAQYFAPFAVIIYGVIAIFVFGIAYAAALYITFGKRDTWG
jgi:hypothetical protein